MNRQAPTYELGSSLALSDSQSEFESSMISSGTTFLNQKLKDLSKLEDSSSSSSSSGQLVLKCKEDRVWLGTFPQKLFSLLNGAEAEGQEWIISWKLDGYAFKVYNRSALAEILPMYGFTSCKFDSLLRQLGHYGFRRILHGKFKGAYHHVNFHRDHEEWLPYVVSERSSRSRLKKSKQQTQAAPAPVVDDFLPAQVLQITKVLKPPFTNRAMATAATKAFAEAGSPKAKASHDQVTRITRSTAGNLRPRQFEQLKAMLSRSQSKEKDTTRTTIGPKKKATNSPPRKRTSKVKDALHKNKNKTAQVQDTTSKKNNSKAPDSPKSDKILQEDSSSSPDKSEPKMLAVVPTEQEGNAFEDAFRGFVPIVKSLQGSQEINVDDETPMPPLVQPSLNTGPGKKRSDLLSDVLQKATSLLQSFPVVDLTVDQERHVGSSESFSNQETLLSECDKFLLRNEQEVPLSILAASCQGNVPEPTEDSCVASRFPGSNFEPNSSQWHHVLSQSVMSHSEVFLGLKDLMASSSNRPALVTPEKQDRPLLPHLGQVMPLPQLANTAGMVSLAKNPCTDETVGGLARSWATSNISGCTLEDLKTTANALQMTTYGSDTMTLASLLRGSLVAAPHGTQSQHSPSQQHPGMKGSTHDFVEEEPSFGFGCHTSNSISGFMREHMEGNVPIPAHPGESIRAAELSGDDDDDDFPQLEDLEAIPFSLEESSCHAGMLDGGIELGIGTNEAPHVMPMQSYGNCNSEIMGSYGIEGDATNSCLQSVTSAEWPKYGHPGRAYAQLEFDPELFGAGEDEL